MLNPLCWCLFASHCFNYSYLKLFLENHQQIPIVNPTLLIIDVWWTLWFHPSELAEIHVYHTWINLNHKYDINHPLQLHYNYINLQRKFQKTIDSRWTTQKKHAIIHIFAFTTHELIMNDTSCICFQSLVFEPPQNICVSWVDEIPLPEWEFQNLDW